MTDKNFDFRAIEDIMGDPVEMEPEEPTKAPAKAARATRQKRVARQASKDVVVSFRLDEAVVNRFNDYAFINKVSKKEALQTIITEYLDGRGLDEVDREILERLRGIHAADKQQAKEQEG